MFTIDGYALLRNDGEPSVTLRPYGGAAVYSCVHFIPGYSYARNINGIEMNVTRVLILPRVTRTGVYHPPKIPA